MNHISREIRIRNDKERGVASCSSYSAQRFYASTSGNLLINGGDKEQRIACILRFIHHIKRSSREPVVVFTENPQTSNVLINLAHNGELGKLIVSSKQYKNYDFFNGMPAELILDFFTRSARENGTADTSELRGYVAAFLSILAARAPLSLTSMCLFAENSDIDIARDGNEIQSNLIMSNLRGGVIFRQLLYFAENALASIGGINCDTAHNIAAASTQDCVLLIKTSCVNFDIVALYFSLELLMIETSFTVVFDDSLLLRNPQLRETAEILKQKPNTTVVASYENIIALNGDLPANFSRNVVLLNGSTPQHDLQSVLSSFGEYTHMTQAKAKQSSPHLLLSLRSSQSQSMVPYQRDRVLLREETALGDAILCGNDSQIIIVRNFII